MSLQIKKKQIENKAIDGSKIELVSGDALKAQDPSQNNAIVDLIEIDTDGDVLVKEKEIAFKTDVTSLQQQITALEAHHEVSITSSAASGTLFTASGRGFIAQVSLVVSNTAELFNFMGIFNGTSWYMSQVSVGQNTGVSFSISSVGVITFSDPQARAKTIKYIITTTSI